MAAILEKVPSWKSQDTTYLPQIFLFPVKKKTVKENHMKMPASPGGTSLSCNLV